MVRKPLIIYNLFPLLAGKANAWGTHIKRADRMGFNWIFLNPVQYPGMSGSLYSIKDYFAFNPLIIDGDDARSAEQQVRAAIAEAAKLGMGVMVDLVINHCAVDSDLLRTNPGWFKWKGDKVVHPSCDENGRKVVWGDLASFDHKSGGDREGLYAFVLRVVEYMISLGMTGFRCDAAYQVPGDLWQRLIRDVKAKHPDTVWAAETLGCSPEQTISTAKAGFDYIFNSSKWWDMSSPWLLDQYGKTRLIAPSISFPESHDTVRLCEELNCNEDGLKQRYAFAALFSGGVMMPLGFEFGFRKRPHVVKSRPEDWEETEIDMSRYIAELNALKSRYPVFQTDAPTRIIGCGNGSVLVMLKELPGSGQKALLVFNKDIHNPQRLECGRPADVMSTGDTIKDVSPGRKPSPGTLSMDLGPGQCMVLVSGG